MIMCLWMQLGWSMSTGVIFSFSFPARSGVRNHEKFYTHVMFHWALLSQFLSFTQCLFSVKFLHKYDWPRNLIRIDQRIICALDCRRLPM